MAQAGPEIFLSYSSGDSFEASLLQFALEVLLTDLNAKVWTYERDQSKSERKISESLKTRVQKSSALLFLASAETFDSGKTQWMELAYADAFNVPFYVLLNKLTFHDLKTRKKGVPPLLLEVQCNAALEWRVVAASIKLMLESESASKVSGPK